MSMAVAVLLDPPILQCITSFMAGPARALSQYSHAAGAQLNTTTSPPTKAVVVRSPVVDTCKRALAEHNRTILRMLEQFCRQPRRGTKLSWGAVAQPHAVYNGELAVLQWLIALTARWGVVREELLDLALRSIVKSTQAPLLWDSACESYREIAEWLYAYRPECCLAMSQLAVTAAAGGDLAFFQSIHTRTGLPLSPDAMVYAAAAGRLDNMLWVHSITQRSYSKALVSTAAANGHVHILKYLMEEEGVPCPLSSMQIAAEHGHVEAVGYLYEHGGLTFNLAATAARAGHLEVVRFCCDNDCGGWDQDWTVVQAVEQGHFAIVQFLHERRAAGCTSAAMNRAAANGHVEVLQYLYTHRNKDATCTAIYAAASNGHTEVVKFLFEHDLSMCSHEALERAERGNHEDITEYIRTQMCHQESMNAGACTCVCVDHAAPSPLLQWFSKKLRFW